MSDQEQQPIDKIISSENLEVISKDDDNNEKRQETEKNPSEQRSTQRITMPQDVRYSIEQNDRDKLMEKYTNYQISDINACNIRFLIDSQQKKVLFGENDEENCNLQAFSKIFHVNIFSGYQNTSKHSYKIFGTEANVRKCLVEIMNRIFKQSNRSTHHDYNKTNDEEKLQIAEPSTDNSCITEETKPLGSTSKTTEEIEVSIENKNVDDELSKNLASTCMITTNPDLSAVDEKETSNSNTRNINEEKSNINIEPEQLKFMQLQLSSQFTFILLISNQGQEVLKKNWNFFAESLQQRLNVIVTNPVKLQKFSDKQIQNELPINGESVENVTDAILQITAFINDILRVPVRPYKPAQELTGHSPHQKNGSYQKQSPSSSYNNQHGRTFFNRNRNDIFEQVILIRHDCVSRIVGTRASNLKHIQAKCHLQDMIVGRQTNENGYVECILTAYQIRNLHFAIDTIRDFLRSEDDSAILVIEPNHDNNSLQKSPYLHELVPPNNPQSNEGTGFTIKPFNFDNNNAYPQPSYNFQNRPSFDFTHQATSASRKTDKRRGELHDQNKTPTESQNLQYENISSNSPRHKSKRSCPETKEIDCITDDGFWIQKQHYHALDDASKQLFDSLIDKLDKIRIAKEENVVRKQHRHVGKNRSNKSKVSNSSISYFNEDINHDEKNLPIKVDQLIDVNEEKENKQETSTTVVNQD
ncbi:unnamed protein product [Adineta steineri]|uniref:K Homology domain-containing protein n=1 Tax=Adineta steineri TaxID=433720 RepID=A0A819EM34_9BILA|nr:unnamed protein product [Adineta steineri]CAF3852961.1 unnamed protein product [Adineta steineri]